MLPTARVDRRQILPTRREGWFVTPQCGVMSSNVNVAGNTVPLRRREGKERKQARSPTPFLQDCQQVPFASSVCARHPCRLPTVYGASATGDPIVPFFEEMKSRGVRVSTAAARTKRRGFLKAFDGSEPRRRCSALGMVASVEPSWIRGYRDPCRRP